MIKIKNINKSFGGLKAVDGINLEIGKGQITAIIGPNGSGKTTLFNLISGIVEKDSGSISLNGKNISRQEDFQRSESGISRTFQHVRLFKNLTIREHFEVALDDDKNLLKKIFSKNKDSGDEIERVMRLIGLEKNIETKANDLSYGQRKLLDIGIGIVKKHDVLMLDEPVAGINPLLRRKIKELIKVLREQGETIVIIEHNMEFVMDLADRVVCLEQGNVIFEGTAKEAQSSKEVLEAYLGK
ncbi:MAG: ABC transporter ATP-binding protein [Nanoarchaeota archaeon]|jgi:ABC-type branched-subunit amino acid transport system ATPase component|nr:ABC transporter ATP-binding protein [Nanoarchaeota archaeon]